MVLGGLLGVTPWEKRAKEELCGPLNFTAFFLSLDSSLPKPFTKVIPQAMLLEDLNATIACRVPMKGLNVTLYKSGSPNASLTLDQNKDTALFHFFLLNAEDTGNYSCRYQAGDFLFSVLSDPAELIVRGEKPDFTLIFPHPFQASSLYMWFQMMAIKPKNPMGNWHHIVGNGRTG